MDDRGFPRLQAPSSQKRVGGYLRALASGPPAVLLLEGGRIAEREALALYWTALLNCHKQERPCLDCAACRQIQTRAFRDLFFFSGRDGQIKIDDVRGIRRVMGQKPDGGPARVIVFSEAQELTPAAANALLKSLEEPLPGNHFLLLSPQRNWLLPTLVSRSFVLTLNWSRPAVSETADGEAWRQRLLQFWLNGQGLFGHTAKKGEVDKQVAQDVLGDCREALRQFMAGEREHPIAIMWADSMPLDKAPAIDRVLSKGFEALSYQATPALVLDWVVLQIWQRLWSARA